MSLIRSLSVLFIFLTAFLGAYPLYNLSIAAIFKDEGPYLKEWIEYHKLVGVEHFYLYDNDSRDNFKEVLSPYIVSGEVELFHWPDNWPDIHFAFGCQAAAYRDALLRASGVTVWVALIDLDEFILPRVGNSVSKILNKYYRNIAAIYVNWLQFGTSNLDVPSGSPTIAYLVRCAAWNNPWNLLGKSIVRPEYVKDCQDAHFCILKENVQYHDSCSNLLERGICKEGYLRINHYTFRDKWYLENIKIPRVAQWNWLPKELYDRDKEFNCSENYEIFRFLPSLLQAFP